LKKLQISKDMEDRLKSINIFIDRPIILASLGQNLHVTFEAAIFGQRLFISVEDIPSCYSTPTLHIFNNKKRLREIIEALYDQGWYVEIEPREI